MKIARMFALVFAAVLAVPSASMAQKPEKSAQGMQKKKPAAKKPPETRANPGVVAAPSRTPPSTRKAAPAKK